MAVLTACEVAPVARIRPSGLDLEEVLVPSILVAGAWTFGAVQLLLDVPPKLRGEIHAEVVSFPKARVGVASLVFHLLARSMLRLRSHGRTQR